MLLRAYGRYSRELTPRERDVLALMTTWLTYAEIGDRLGVSLNTVKSHARSIYRKFGVGSRREAVAHANEHALIRVYQPRHGKPTIASP